MRPCRRRIASSSGSRTCHEDLPRARLLEAARELFLGQGYSAIGLREVAAKAGVDVTLVRRYFGSKQRLFTEATDVSENVEEIRNAADDAVGQKMIARVLGARRDVDAPLFALLRSSGDPLVVAHLNSQLDAGLTRNLAKRITADRARFAPTWSRLCCWVSACSGSYCRRSRWPAPAMLTSRRCSSRHSRRLPNCPRAVDSAGVCVAQVVQVVKVVQVAFRDRVLDAISQSRARPGACGIATGLTYFGEVCAALRRFGVPLHRGVARPQPLDRDRDVAEPAIHRLQARREIPLAVGAGGLCDRRRALRVVGEIP